MLCKVNGQEFLLLSIILKNICMYMANIETVLGANLADLFNFQEKVVVIIDILRATSTITTLASKDVSKILATDDVEHALSLKEKNDFLAIGERNGMKVKGFDFGNSPYEIRNASLKGKKVVITTTNGTKVMKMSESASEVLIGSFHNLQALANRISNGSRDIILFCAGWKGRVNMEDTLFAGAVISNLQTKSWHLDDSSKIAKSVYSKEKNNLYKYMLTCEHPKRLKTKFKNEDIQICFEQNSTSIIPKVKNMEVIL